ncbi:hypothetical protein KC315_g18257, partial [Hortaea werneckii]
MAEIHAFPLDIKIIASGAALVVAAWALYAFLSEDVEKAVDFTVPAPDPCKPDWKAKTLDEPNIKVAGSTAVQCYAPATGQLLGFIDPVTADDIDRLVAKAAQAQ